LLAIAHQLYAWGFRQVAILNTHGGNTAVIAYTLREIRARYGLQCGVLAPNFDLEVPAQEAAFGYHANTAETAWLLAIAPQLVRMDEAAREYCGSVDAPGELRPERAPATMAWVTADLSKSGVMGDAKAATAEQGAAWLARGAQRTADAIAEVCRLGKVP